MNVEVDRRFPLSWPAGRPRTNSRVTSAFKRDRSFAEARDLLLHELHLLGARRTILSSNMALRQDGLPRSGQAQPSDPGVAVYFELTAGTSHAKPHAMACDRWRHIEDNVYAIAKHVEALRGQQRWGVATVEQAFAGFAQLPPARAAGRSWLEVLGMVGPLPTDAATRAHVLDLAERQFKALAQKAHPDVGGSAEAMADLIAARDSARRDLA